MPHSVVSEAQPGPIRALPLGRAILQLPSVPRQHHPALLSRDRILVDVHSARGATAHSESPHVWQVEERPNEEVLRDQASRGDDLQPEQGEGQDRLEVRV